MLNVQSFPETCVFSLTKTELVTHCYCFLDNFEVKDDEITLKGFLDLNMMEAQDADGDPNDLWLTLENMGFNKALELDQVQYTYLWD